MSGKKFDRTVKTEMGKMSTAIINDDYMGAEKSLKSGIAVYVASAVAKGMTEIRKQEDASRK
jgi:hypothetical protein